MSFTSFQFILVFMPIAYIGFLLAHRLGGWNWAINFLALTSLAFYSLLPGYLVLVLVVPKCAACLYAKIRRKPWRTNQLPGSVKDSLMVMPCLLPQGPLLPGTTSIDHSICA